MQWMKIFQEIYEEIIKEVGEIDVFNVNAYNSELWKENVSMTELGINSLLYMKLLISLEDKYPQINTETLTLFNLNEPLSVFFTKIQELYQEGQER